jgi:hypothetical protein
VRAYLEKYPTQKGLVKWFKMVEHLPRKCEALGSSTVPPEKKRQKLISGTIIVRHCYEYSPPPPPKKKRVCALGT